MKNKTKQQQHKNPLKWCKIKRRRRGRRSAASTSVSSASCLLVHSSTYADYHHMILLGFCSCVIIFLQVFFLFVSCSFLFLIFIILLLSRLPHMDSPLSRSPGSSVLIGVGLPTTRPSSVLGGPQRLEYCCTPPHSSSLPALAALLAPPPPRLPVFQWPMECDVADAPPPSRVWLVPGLACQLVVGVSDWPCAKKRFTSSSPANSARMVVLPSTHLHKQNEIKSILIPSHTHKDLSWASWSRI